MVEHAGFLSVSSFSDDLDVLLRFQNRTQSFSDNRMIVGDQDPYNLRFKSGRRFHDGIGTVRTMSAGTTVSNFPSICEALLRMLRNSKPSLAPGDSQLHRDAGKALRRRIMN